MYRCVCDIYPFCLGVNQMRVTSKSALHWLYYNPKFRLHCVYAWVEVRLGNTHSARAYVYIRCARQCGSIATGGVVGDALLSPPRVRFPLAPRARPRAPAGKPRGSRGRECSSERRETIFAGKYQTFQARTWIFSAGKPNLFYILLLIYM